MRTFHEPSSANSFRSIVQSLSDLGFGGGGGEGGGGGAGVGEGGGCGGGGEGRQAGHAMRGAAKAWASSSPSWKMAKSK